MAEDKNKVKIIQPFEGSQDLFVRSSADIAFFGGNLGGGKDLSDSELVLTPNGWKRNGDLKVGDVVNTPYGEPQPIRAIYPHSEKDIYELRTSDGRCVECSIEHLWEVRTKKQVHKYRQHRERKNFFVLETSEIKSRIEKGEPLFIQIPNAQEFSQKVLPIDPYLLGVLIGDGCLTKVSEKSNSVEISNAEWDIINKCSDIINSESTVSRDNNYSVVFHNGDCNKINQYLIKCGLNTYSYNRFIPQEYLFGSIEQRKLLLAGLFDTDGCIEDKNRFSFSTTSERLKDDFVHLCRSLGYIVRIKSDCRMKYTNGNIAYDISICTFDKIFSSEKHIRRYEDNERKYDYCYHRTENHVRIESIKFKKRETATCIFLDYPDHLYIAHYFLTTHNTAGAILSNAEP